MQSGRSLMKPRKRGIRTEPWGTPNVAGQAFGSELSKERSRRLYKKAWIQDNTLGERLMADSSHKTRIGKSVEDSGKLKED